MLKRILDIILSFALLVLFFPLIIFVGILIKMMDRGPIFFSQMRVGHKGRLFKLLKFRSMSINAEMLQRQLLGKNLHVDGPTFKIKEDPRVTWLGRYLRKSSVDEIPQLVNVLKGEMSLVGPRPPLPHEVAQYGPYERKRLEVKPGLTCLWQISGRSDLPFSHQIQLDRKYVETRNLILDAKILVLTIPAVVLGKGAY